MARGGSVAPGSGVGRWRSTRASLPGAALLSLVACAERPTIPGAVPFPRAPAAPVLVSDATLLLAGETVRFFDPRSGIGTTLPEGWAGSLRFPADDSGPPPEGEVRARFR